MTQSDSLLALISSLHAQLVESQAALMAARQRIAELEKAKSADADA